MTCPVCQKASAAKYRPFCSRRCADVDLGRWLNGHYRLPDDAPVEPTTGSEAEPTPAPR